MHGTHGIHGREAIIRRRGPHGKHGQIVARISASVIRGKPRAAEPTEGNKSRAPRATRTGISTTRSKGPGKARASPIPSPFSPISAPRAIVPPLTEPGTHHGWVTARVLSVRCASISGGCGTVVPAGAGCRLGPWARSGIVRARSRHQPRAGDHLRRPAGGARRAAPVSRSPAQVGGGPGGSRSRQRRPCGRARRHSGVPAGHSRPAGPGLRLSRGLAGGYTRGRLSAGAPRAAGGGMREERKQRRHGPHGKS